MTTATQPLNSQRPKASPQERNRHLQRLRRARAQQAKLEERLKASNDEVRQLIKDGFDLGISGLQLGEAAGLGKARAYQIRDDK
ncbi:MULTISPECIES: hypothetical protein [Mycolicibacterium]|uniref:HTH DNA binding protein n=1 Tax=Mycobacterium phage Bipper TaxID=1805457 RepID=A0A142F2G8_9CAUD|nr:MULTISPECIES: hypothetical protein [Mycolicibacterium]YP_009303187.1 HTH DNA binding protein [Mycobacterium phage Bipper]QDF19326.1 hypothetical protein SEA_CRACKLEWINK_39 [Mycobacterium phage Cracklewink]AMQ66975.1 HTH DNA binding protein [Mycobacterium phage Bipper]MCC9181057.1 hypothetical protein [Mycolicibacterium mageritense]UBV14777.1 hypothetical protein H8Z57_29450 [Mycolicibacterium fortuitum]